MCYEYIWLVSSLAFHSLSQLTRIYMFLHFWLIETAKMFQTQQKNPKPEYTLIL